MPPKRWLVLSVRAPDETVLDPLAEALLGLGGTAVDQDVDLLTTYVPEPADPEAFVRAAARTLAEAAGGRAPEIVWRLQPHEDWARRWRRGLKPRRVGPRLIVTPSWRTPEPRPGDEVIVIDPEMAFGTGEHASTRGALRLLQEAEPAGARVLDVGTGSGILAIAAARLGAKQVLAVESDADALENARANLERNGVADRVELVHAVVDSTFLTAGEPRFELILANVLSGVLVPLLPGFHRALTPGGRLILGGILEEEAEDVIAAAEVAGFSVRVEDLEEEWWAVLLQREDR